MGILANHVPSIEPLRPGVVEVVESGNSSQKWFGMLRSKTMPRDLSTNIYLLRFTVSGGFATVHPNNKLTINAVEAAPLEDFSLEVRILFFHSVVCVNHLRRLFVPTWPNRRRLLVATDLKRTKPKRRLRLKCTRRSSTL